MTLPAVIDVGGNAADLYRLEWFDHAVHLTNACLPATTFGVALAGNGLPRPAMAGLTLGFGSVLHTIWEIVEYPLDVLYDAALDVSAQTTIRDFAAGLTGAAVAALIVGRRLHDRDDLGGRLLVWPEPDGPGGRPTARR